MNRGAAMELRLLLKTRTFAFTPTRFASHYGTAGVTIKNRECNRAKILRGVPVVKTKYSRVAISLAFVAASLIYVIWHQKFAHVPDLIGLLSPGMLFGIAVALTLGTLLAGERLRYAAKDSAAGCQREVVRALFIGLQDERRAGSRLAR